jgi:hypothetical protein
VDPLLDAFLSDAFTSVYSRFATAHWARDALRLDVLGVHAQARLAINSVIGNAHGDGDPGSRIVLIKGEAGLGKTHVLSTELARFASRGRAFPVMMQLAVSIAPEELSRWMLKKIFDELMSSSFPDADGHRPMERLALLLWSHAPAEHAAFQSRIDDDPDDEEAIEKIAVKAARRICRALRAHDVTMADRTMVAGILARAEDYGSAFKSWINHSSVNQRFGGLTLEPLQHEDDRRDLIVSLARVCRACGSPFILAIDQIESTEQIASLDLLRNLLVYAVNLVDDSLLGTGLIICALSDTFDKLKTMPASLLHRIEYAPAPVQLRPLKPPDVQRMLQRRAQVLLERRSLGMSEVDAAAAFSPAWLFEGTTGRPRATLERVLRYQEACREAGRFLAQQEFSLAIDGQPVGPDGPSPPDGSIEPEGQLDFDKLWEDRRDAAIGGVRNFSDQQRLELLGWAIEQAAPETPGLHATRISHREIEGAEPTRVLRAAFMLDDDTCLEAWDIGYVDAPVRKGRLRKQIEQLIDDCTDAKPAICRADKIAGFNGTKPDRPNARLRKMVTGPALVSLLEVGGRVCPTESRHWEELATAREFVGEYADATGFERWRRERRFLTHECDIGPIAQLAVPEGKPEQVPPAPGPPSNPVGPSPAPPGHADGRGDPPPSSGHHANNGAGSAGHPAGADADDDTNSGTGTGPDTDSGADGDPRDGASVLIGRAGQTPVFWNLDRRASPTLPNFGLTVSGDAGQGKTQIIMAILAEAARLQCPVLVFDFKNDYTGDFARANGFTVVDLQNGLPFNPLRPPPQGPSGTQIMRHVYGVTSVMGSTLGLGDQQSALLRNSIAKAFEEHGQPLDDWLPVESIRAPSLGDAIAIAEGDESTTATSLVNRLGLLHGLKMCPDDAGATVSFDELMAGRFVLSFNALPNDDRLKAVLAEMILIQLQGFMLRGEQPRALRRMLVFDEAWRASQSARLIQLAREGRAFGVGVVVGTQFPDDLSADLVGNLASKLYLYNGDAQRRRRIVQSTFGKVTGADANSLSDALAGLERFEGVFSNQQHQPYVSLRIVPYFERS